MKKPQPKANTPTRRPKYVWADCDDTASPDQRWAFYRSKADQRANRPDLPPVRLCIAMADDIAAKGYNRRIGNLNELRFAELRQANQRRNGEWVNGTDAVPDLAYRGVELSGEVGEACNVIKKLERERHGWRGSRATREELAQELADVIIAADLIAMDLNIDLGAAVHAKFDATSKKYGLKTRMATDLD